MAQRLSLVQNRHVKCFAASLKLHTETLSHQIRGALIITVGAAPGLIDAPPDRVTQEMTGNESAAMLFRARTSQNIILEAICFSFAIIESSPHTPPLIGSTLEDLFIWACRFNFLPACLFSLNTFLMFRYSRQRRDPGEHQKV